MIWLSCSLAFLCLVLAENRTLTNSTYVGNASAPLKGIFSSQCSDNDDCGASLFCIYGVCSCASNEYWKSDRCLKKKTVNSTCTSSFECAGKLACIRGECKCAEEFNWNGTDCLIRLDINTTCNVLLECKQSLICSNNTCVCCDNDYWNGHFCEKKRNFETRCNVNEECRDTLHCVHGICQCRENEFRSGTICETDACYSKDSCFNGGKCLQDKFSESIGYKCKCTDGYLGERCQYSDGKASNFILIFQTVTSYMIIPTDARVRLSIYRFDTNKNSSHKITTGQVEYGLSSNTIVATGLHRAGFEVHSDIPITLYGFTYKSGYEGYLAIPTKYASTQYIIPSFNVLAGSSVFSLSPLRSRTIVHINFRMSGGSIFYEGVKYSNNDTLTIMMNKYSTFQLSHGFDLTGTLISASKPVIVVSGNTYNYIESGSGHNAFIEMILPIEQLDIIFIIPYLAKREKSTIRLIAVEDTNVTKRIGNEYSQSVLKSRDYMDLIHNTISYIRSSNSIMVQIYPHEVPSNEGDPFMMTIPGINQYLYDYLFMALSGYTSNISITVETVGIDGFVLDGHFLTIPNVFSISEENGKFSSFSLPITPGTHHLTHRRKTRFGLWVYGIKSDDSYGYPAGIAYKYST